MYQIIQNRKIWASISGVAMAASLVALLLWGLNLGIDFTGGSLLEVRYLNERPSVVEARESLNGLDLGSLVVQPVGENGMILRFQDTTEEKHQAVLAVLDGRDAPADTGSGQATSTAPENDAETEAVAALVNIEELRFDSVGPSIGQELKRKSTTAIIFVLIAIALYIAWVFRKVSKPVASWKYGVAAIIALFHDVLITLGVFAVLSRFYGVEVNTPFVAAILTILGYSVNDTIVVFDRIRENLPKSDEDFESTINASVNQTLGRSINTSVTVLLVLLSILFLGGGTIKDFVLALSIGVFIGTYSSIFVASPALVIWEKITNRS